MKFVFYTDEGGVSLSDITVALQGDDGVTHAEVPLAAVLAVDEQVPMLSLDFKNRYFAAMKHIEKRKRLELAARINSPQALGPDDVAEMVRLSGESVREAMKASRPT
jgi:hypothetical protein